MVDIARLEKAVDLLNQLNAYKDVLQAAAEQVLSDYDQHPSLSGSIKLRHLLAARDHGTLTIRLNTQMYQCVLRYLQEQSHGLQQENPAQENADAR